MKPTISVSVWEKNVKEFTHIVKQNKKLIEKVRKKNQPNFCEDWQKKEEPYKQKVLIK
jgi:hypothetical protein